MIKKKKGSKDSDDRGVPFWLSDQEIKIADERALSILIPRHIDYLPGAIFSASTHWKSHDYKQVIKYTF